MRRIVSEVNMPIKKELHYKLTTRPESEPNTQETINSSEFDVWPSKVRKASYEAWDFC